MAFTAPMALRSMQGICTSPPMGSQVMPRLCSMPISAACSTCALVPSERRHQTAGRHRTSHADFALASDFGAGNRGVLLVEDADRAAPSAGSGRCLRRTRLDVAQVVLRHGRDQARPRRWWARSRRGRPAAFSSFTAMAKTLTQSITASGSDCRAPQFARQARRAATHVQALRAESFGRRPRWMQSCIACQMCAR